MSSNPVECEVCDGLGIVTKNVPIEHPDFGKTFPCPACNIALQRKRSNILKLSNLDLYWDKTFDAFKLKLSWLDEPRTEHLEIVVKQAQKYAANPVGWLLFMGNTGAGKTHLAAAIAHEVLARNERVIFATAPDLLDYLRATFAPHSEITYDQQFELLRSVYLLVIDDLGAESPSRWAQEKLYQLLNHRYNAKLPTVITTNLKEDDFEDRIASRILDLNVCKQLRMNLPDYRRGGHDLEQRNTQNDMTNMFFPLYGNMTFQSFELLHSERTQSEKVNLIKRYAEYPEGWLTIIGGSGSGKTHLAAAIANYFNSGQQEAKALMMSFIDLIDYLRAAFHPDALISVEQRFDAIRNVPLLILDDFALSSKTSEWVAQKIFQLLDYRYLKELPTVFAIRAGDKKLKRRGDHATELDVLQEEYPEIYSRLADREKTALIVLTLPDYRLRNKR